MTTELTSKVANSLVCRFTIGIPNFFNHEIDHENHALKYFHLTSTGKCESIVTGEVAVNR